MIQELVQYVPFDEASGNKAHDLSGKDNHLDITGSHEWKIGKKNNGLYFSSTSGFAEIIGSTIVDLQEDFTYTFWFKADIIGSTPTATWLLYKFAGLDDYLYLDANTNGRAWTYVAIVQEGTLLLPLVMWLR